MVLHHDGELEPESASGERLRRIAHDVSSIVCIIANSSFGLSLLRVGFFLFGFPGPACDHWVGAGIQQPASCKVLVAGFLESDERVFPDAESSFLPVETIAIPPEL